MRNKLFYTIALALSSSLGGSPLAAQILIDSVKIKSEAELKKLRYNQFRALVANQPPDLPKLFGIERRNVRILFVSPDTETQRREFLFVGGLIKPSKGDQDLLAIDNKLLVEFPWIALEIFGFVSRVDAVESEFFRASIETDYDYVVTIATDFNGKRDAKSLAERKFIYKIRKAHGTNSTVISEGTGILNNQGAIAALLFKAIDKLEEQK